MTGWLLLGAAAYLGLMILVWSWMAIAKQDDEQRAEAFRQGRWPL